MINNVGLQNYMQKGLTSCEKVKSQEKKEPACTPIKRPSVSFAAAEAAKTAVIAPSTQLRNKEEIQKYNNVAQNLNKDNQKTLNTLLKTGVLLSDKTNDKSTLLDNLSAICTTERLQGLDAKGILNETVSAIANPFIITQQFGNVPDSMATQILDKENEQRIKEGKQNQENGKPLSQPLITKADLKVTSSSCVAASIEFNLAKNQPAEFARMINEVTSPKYSIDKTVNIDNISTNMLEAKWLLEEFNTDFEIKSLDKVKVKIAPDKNALIRAKIQTVDKDPGERSVIDVLLQSTFMNIGSQKSYNSLTDTRTGKYNPDNRGLTDIEKNIAEVLATGNGKVSVTYQILDDNGKLTGYECDLKTTKQQITDALKMGENVIIGYTYTDEDKVVQGGHEITILDIKKAKDGKEYFVCNDTDDNLSAPVYYEVNEFLPKIHHAGLPKTALKDDVEFVQNWKEMIKQYKDYRNAA